MVAAGNQRGEMVYRIIRAFPKIRAMTTRRKAMRMKHIDHLPQVSAAGAPPRQGGRQPKSPAPTGG